MSIIVPKLHFFQVQGELLFGYPMELSQPFLGVAPESFQAVNVDLTPSKMLAMVHPQMPIPTKHQGIIASKFIRVHDTPSSHFLQGGVEQDLSTDIRNHLHSHDPVSFQNTENRHFPCGSAASFTLSSASEVGLIRFDLSSEQLWGIESHNRLSDQMAGPQDRRIAQPDFFGDSPSRDLQLEQFDDPQPLDRRDAKLTHKATSEVRKFVPTALTPVAATGDPIDLSLPTSNTESGTLFPTRFSQVSAGFVLGSDAMCKFINNHAGTSILLVPNVLQSP